MWKKDITVSTQPPPSMATYTDAMNKFTKAATAFMEHVHLLTEARDACQEAMTASTALRNSLEAGDLTLRSLMTQMEQVVNAHLGEPALDKKRPEALKPDALKVEETRKTGENRPPRGIFSLRRECTFRSRGEGGKKKKKGGGGPTGQPARPNKKQRKKKKKPTRRSGLFYISVDSRPLSAQTFVRITLPKKGALVSGVSYVSPTTSWPPGSCRQKSSPHRPLSGYARGARCRPAKSRSRGA